MYLAPHEIHDMRGHGQDKPNGTYRFTVMDHLGNFIAFLNFMDRTSCDRFLDKYSDSGEMFKNLRFDVTATLQRTAEHGWAANDNDPGTLARSHVFDKFFKVLIDTSVLIRRDDEGIALLLQDGRCPINCRINQGHNFETTAKFAGRENGCSCVDQIWARESLLFEAEGMVPGAFIGSYTAESAWTWAAGKKLTKHDIPCANKDDVEVIGTTDMARSGGG